MDLTRVGLHGHRPRRGHPLELGVNSFAQRFLKLAVERSPLCLGLDPSRELVRDWGLSDDASGLRRFCEVVMEAAADRIAVVKPQSGFFERLGPPGLSELAGGGDDS